eukprot:6118940-Amphidinium_carterae.1
MDIGQMNQPDFYGRVYYLVLVAGLRVKLSDESSALLPWYVPLEDKAPQTVADAVFKVVIHGQLRCVDGKKTRLLKHFVHKGSMQYVSENQFTLLRTTFWTKGLKSVKVYDANFWREVVKGHIRQFHIGLSMLLGAYSREGEVCPCYAALAQESSSFGSYQTYVTFRRR